jgi:DNA polymerase-3 subunit epsilon
LGASAENVAQVPGPAPSASAEETEKVLRWLESAGVRLVAIDGEWTCPVHGAGAARAALDPDVNAYRDVIGFDEPGGHGLRHHTPAVSLASSHAPVLPETLVLPKTLSAAG